jgi:peptide-methionine (R)-S-oxide reductase
MTRIGLLLAALTFALVACESGRGDGSPPGDAPPGGTEKEKEKVVKSDEEWRAILTPEEYRILRQKGTERPGTGEYEHTTTPGTYVCKGCGQPLFSSGEKFDSGCGWPAFSAPLGDGEVTEQPDLSLGMRRVEILCSRCDGHLGHVFEDGPAPTGLRYCVNSASLRLVEEEDGSE